MTRGREGPRVSPDQGPDNRGAQDKDCLGSQNYLSNTIFFVCSHLFHNSCSVFGSDHLYSETSILHLGTVL